MKRATVGVPREASSATARVVVFMLTGDRRMRSDSEGERIVIGRTENGKKASREETDKRVWRDQPSDLRRGSEEPVTKERQATDENGVEDRGSCTGWEPFEGERRLIRHQARRAGAAHLFRSLTWQRLPCLLPSLALNRGFKLYYRPRSVCGGNFHTLAAKPPPLSTETPRHSDVRPLLVFPSVVDPCTNRCGERAAAARRAIPAGHGREWLPGEIIGSLGGQPCRRSALRNCRSRGKVPSHFGGWVGGVGGGAETEEMKAGPVETLDQQQNTQRCESGVPTWLRE
ncbi:hypothetical protein VTK73DRAFT_2396 [Phialemonium thermophilum]|uniref:Uncharacterized protein n=1 Tax=Phialemonium thermophilum TaxID=223376 RepID=A0ABR3VS55_9PEZI